MKVIKTILNALHLIYCMIYFCAIDTPALLRWEWYWWIVFYVATMPLFIWGIIRLIKESKKEQEEKEVF